jgi:hypothetical protein
VWRLVHSRCDHSTVVSRVVNRFNAVNLTSGFCLGNKYMENI